MSPCGKVANPLISALIGLLVGCEEPQALSISKQLDSPSHPAAPSSPLEIEEKPGTAFPIEKSLSDLNGRSVNVWIVGRSEDRVYVVRKSDGLKSEISIGQLSPDDQAFAKTLSNQLPPEAYFRSEDSTSKQESEAMSDFVKQRLARIEDLSKENFDLEVKNRIITNELEIRANRSKIDRNQDEIDRLNESIQRYQLAP